MQPHSSRGLDVHQVTLQLIAGCAPCGDRLRRFNRRLGDQLVESLSSTPRSLTGSSPARKQGEAGRSVCAGLEPQGCGQPAGG